MLVICHHLYDMYYRYMISVHRANYNVFRIQIVAEDAGIAKSEDPRGRAFIEKYVTQI